ncbi:MAG TPA: hypothetical protein GX692_01040 [Acholeplasmataceae bacterium]|jgi:putative flippase GtrA|nr:hypothetical protein [Acholeplasmataceae bacterium]
MTNIFKTFFSRNFIIFCIIGIINTLVHLAIFNLLLAVSTLLANTVAFITASVFSYFANATFTYRSKTNHSSFIQAMLTFLAKLFLSNALTLGFEKLILHFNKPELIKYIPIPVTFIILPFQFLVFNRIFKKKQET